jgi:DNA-binding SARP family transcriptional activator
MPATLPTFEVHLLGGFHIVRADGSIVESGALGTGKTVDLMRILALDNGRLVRSKSIIEVLWPDVVPSRGRGSLRTAASRIRSAVGQDCIERQSGDLKLVSAVVDVDEYRELVKWARQAASRRAHAETLLLVEASEAMYLDDFHASDDEGPWAVYARSELMQVRRGALANATQAALECGRFDEALALAETAVHLDPTCEGSQRHLMRAYVGLGEIGQALRVFEIYRAHLAEELGIDPSRATRELHLHLLKDSE